MTDDELVEHYFPARWFPYAQREVAKALAAFTQPARALRAALARAERAEALVREAGVMLKEREWDDPVCPDGYLEGMACSNCLAHEDNKHDPGCHYAALLTRIAELEKP